MPVDMGSEGKGGPTGDYRAAPSHVADKILEARENMPASLRVVFKIAGLEDKLSLFVPLTEDAARRLRPFMPDHKGPVPTTEKELREFIAANIGDHERLVYAYRGSIRSVKPEPGSHRFRFGHLYKRDYEDGPKAYLIMETKDNKTVRISMPYNAVTAKKGAEPEDDDISFNPNKFLIRYLVPLGLDYKRFGKEVAQAYKDGKLFTRLGLDGPVEGFFSDPNDVTPELCDAVRRHGLQWVRIEIEDHPEYGIGPVRGEWSFVKMKEIEVEEAASQEDAEFQREAARFLENYENLTRAVLNKADARFVAGGKLTDDGLPIAKATLVPFVRGNPTAAKESYPDGHSMAGKPIVQIPPTPDRWTVNGLVAANLIAERLLQAEAAETGALFEIVKLNGDADAFLAWVAENVPEAAGDLGDAEEGTEL